MKTKINIEGVEEEIEIREPTGIDQMEWLKILSQIQKESKNKKESGDEEEVEDILKALNVKDELVLKFCKRFSSIEEIQKLELKEKEKILNALSDRFNGNTENIKN